MMMNCDFVHELLQQVREAPDVRFVERRVEFVEQAERRGLDHVEREQQRHGGERLLPAGEQRDALEPGAGRLGDDLDAAFQDVVGLDELEVRMPPPKSVWNVYSKFFLICSNVTLNCCCEVWLISSMALSKSALALVRSSLCVLRKS
jgi:hypothetical protein